MKLDNYIDKILKEVMSTSGIEKVKNIMKEDMSLCGFEYNNTKVECQVYTNDNNYNPRVEISSENYSDGEVIFIDYHVSDIHEIFKKEGVQIKDMEYYYCKDKVEKIKAKAMKSKDIKHIDQCIKELINLYKELDQSKDNENYEAFDLVNDACRKLNEYKKTLEK